MNRSSSMVDLSLQRKRFVPMRRQCTESSISRLPNRPLRACFLRNKDPHFKGVLLLVCKKHYPVFNKLLEAITSALQPHVLLKSAIRRIYRIDGTLLKSLDDIYEGDIIVCCCMYEPFVEMSYNVSNTYIAMLGAIIKRKKLDMLENESLNSGSSSEYLIDANHFKLPQAILLYIDILKTVFQNRGTVIFEGNSKFTPRNRYIIKRVDREYVVHQTKRAYLEINILRELQHHPNIIDLVYTVEQCKYVYIVVGRLTCDVWQMIQNHAPVSERLIKYIIKKVAKGLEYIHSCQIIHRDLKPENLLVRLKKNTPFDPDITEVKIADFGLATYYSGGVLKEWCGTTHYMAPEVISDAGYDYRVDLWSLGVTLYFMLFEKLPFANETDNKNVILKSIKRGTYKMSNAAGREISVEARDLIRALLVKAPRNRLSLSDIIEHPFLQAYDSISLD